MIWLIAYIVAGSLAGGHWLANMTPLQRRIGAQPLCMFAAMFWPIYASALLFKERP